MRSCTSCKATWKRLPGGGKNAEPFFFFFWGGGRGGGVGLWFLWFLVVFGFVFWRFSVCFSLFGLGLGLFLFWTVYFVWALGFGQSNQKRVHILFPVFLVSFISEKLDGSEGLSTPSFDTFEDQKMTHQQKGCMLSVRDEASTCVHMKRQLLPPSKPPKKKHQGMLLWRVFGCIKPLLNQKKHPNCARSSSCCLGTGTSFVTYCSSGFSTRLGNKLLSKDFESHCYPNRVAFYLPIKLASPPTKTKNLTSKY